MREGTHDCESIIGAETEERGVFLGGINHRSPWCSRCWRRWRSSYYDHSSNAPPLEEVEVVEVEEVVEECI